MARLQDLLAPTMSVGVEGDVCIYIAQFVGIDMPSAKRLYCKYGRGHIITKSGVAYNDTPENRHGLPRRLGADCLIVPQSGSCYIVTAKGERRAFKELLNAQIEREDRAQKREMARSEEEYHARKKMDMVFRDGQTMPSPKRQGKANSLEDIGKYQNRPYQRARVADMVARCRTYKTW